MTGSDWRDLLWYVIGFLTATIVIAFALQDNIKIHNACQVDLATCQQTLNDPHACVSVVVEAMEGKYEQTNLNNKEAK